MAIHPKSIRTNHRIRAAQIRLIGAAGEQVGIVTVPEGIKMAQDAGLDLVEISPSASPPVCRILDFGKYLYSLTKKEKESRKKQRVISVKEIKMSSKIEEHDYQTKLRNAHRFLSRGDKVKLTMFFRGREITHTDIGQKIIHRFIEDVSDVAQVERNDGLDGRTILVYFSPISAPKKPSLKMSEKGGEDAEAKDE